MKVSYSVPMALT